MSSRNIMNLGKGIVIESIQKRKSTRINIHVGTDVFCLKEMRTSAVCILKFVVKGKYIIAYSTTEENGQLKKRLEAIFDLKKLATIVVTKENRYALEYMTISKKEFTLATVLEYLNQGRLNAASEEECVEFETYIRGGNSSLTRERILKHIFKTYPKLKEYVGINHELKLTDYQQIIRQIGSEELYFHIIPNGL